MRLPLCIMGCGGYARTVLNDIHDMTDVVELYFASRDIAKAREYCETFGGAGYFGSYEDAIADPRVKAAYFFTPHDIHLDNALMAAKHSKHILVEKPIARTVEESREMIRAAREAGVRLMVGENYRFLPTVRRAKQIIEQGNIGTLRLIQAHGESYRKPTSWRTNLEMTGGGVFIDGGIHFVDVLMYLGGFPLSLSAERPPKAFRNIGGEDGMALMARLPGGVVGLINFSRGTPIKDNRQRISVTGTDGQLAFVPYGGEIEFEDVNGKRTIRLPEARRGVRGMITEFRDAIAEGRDPEMSGEEALLNLVVVLGAYQSADEKREVELAPP
ncbi:MAG: Gfo/Idh/MocA family oxidoreductase [Chloroflexi bacterium]|nr:Gfo/Idh/MocA family oxidoreductase [Chloroflexota bacterium]